MVLLRLFDYQGALTVRYHRLRSFYRRRLFAAYNQKMVLGTIFLILYFFPKTRLLSARFFLLSRNYFTTPFIACNPVFADYFHAVINQFFPIIPVIDLLHGLPARGIK